MPSRRQLNHIPINYHRILEFGSGMTVTSTYNAGPRGGKTEITTISSAASGHTVTYGSLAPATAGTSVGQEYIQTSNGTSTGILMNTWVWDGTAWYNNDQPINLTRAQLLTLRNAGQLRQSQHYLITDHIQGRLVAGTTILVHATADNEISENVTVNTTYDNEGWQGVYDLDRALVLELTDNRMNTAKGLNGSEVSNFDWGNTAYYNNTVIGSTLTVTYGATASVFGNNIENATINLTGFTGSFYQNRVHILSNINLTNANGLWRYNTWRHSAQLVAIGYTGGGDNYYNTFDSNSIVISGKTTSVGFRNNNIIQGSISSQAGTGTFTLTNSSIRSQSITHSSSGVIAISQLRSDENGSISHTGTGTLNIAATENNGSIALQSTGNLTVNYSKTAQSAVFRNSGTAPVFIQRTISDGANSSVYTDAGSSTTTNVTDCNIQSSGLIRVVGAVGGGAFNVSSTRIASNSFIYKRNTGSLTVTAGEIIQSSGIDAQSGNRSYVLNRCIADRVCRYSFTGTGAFTDSLNDVALVNRASLNISCSGANNTINYAELNGLSAGISLSGTTGNQIIQRHHANEASFNIANTSVAMTHDLNIQEQVGTISYSNVTAAKPLVYSRTGTTSGITVTNATVAGALTRLNASMGASITVTGVAGTATNIKAEIGGAININGGTNHNNIWKIMPGTLTTGNFSQNNIMHISPVGFTCTAANSNRATYLGLVSAVPIV